MSAPDTLERLLDLAIAIQQIPAPTFEETRRAAFILERFRAENLSDVAMDAAGNVYARLPGSGGSRPLVVSAHLDTVFPLSTDLRLTHGGVDRGEIPGPENPSSEAVEGSNQNKIESRRLKSIEGPGIGDNSLGVAGLFGLLWELRARAALRPLPGDVWLVANVGEEGLGNLCGMQAVVDRFDGLPLAYLVLEGMALGQIYHRGLGVQRYRIAVNTPGGHSWVDYGRPSAVHVLGELITRLAGMNLPKEPRTTLNIGMVSGGTSVNTIAASAQLELDLRSESTAVLASLAARVEALVKLSSRPDVQVSAQVIGKRPYGEISPQHPLVRLAAGCLEELGIPPRLNIGSTDANIPLSRGYPSICLGMTSGSGAHTLAETIQVAPLASGLKQLVMVVERIFERL
jgi:acetylornithine deacetylase/succinyl-diaminopimelate desuccinylase-like protein